MTENRYARPENFGHPIRTPLLREHFVYRAYNAAGELLYVGCTKDLPGRMKAHKSTGDWYPHMVRLAVKGPHNYETARFLEREGIRGDRPLYNSQTPERTAVNAAHDRIRDRRHGALMDQGMEFWEAFHIAKAHAEALVPQPPNRHGFRSDDLTIAAALRADRDDAATYEQAAS